LGDGVVAGIVTQVQDNGLTVPLDAVQQGPQGQYVFVVGADHKVAMQPVSVRETLNGEALIDKGLSAGETVVVRGQYRLSGTRGDRGTVPYGSAFGPYATMPATSIDTSLFYEKPVRQGV
jgi:multidrug efflux pump subunit AcrA (membrane-fusion protein)